MKKRYISLIVIVVLLTLLAGTWYFISNHHTVVFTLKDSDYTLEIDTTEGKKVTEIDAKNSSAWLWKGEYTYKAIGDKYDNTKQSFTVTDSDKDISVNPNYSDSYLASLLTDSEYSAINSALRPYLSKVPASQQSLRSLALYERGQWAAGTIEYTEGQGAIPEIYRFVLEKKDKDSAWQVVVKPTIAIYSANYPEVPREILDNLYS